MTKKYPLTYEEYEKKVTELFLKLYSQDKQDMGMERLNELLDEDSQFILLVPFSNRNCYHIVNTKYNMW